MATTDPDPFKKHRTAARLVAVIVIMAIFGGVLWSWLQGGFFGMLLSRELETAEKLDLTVEYFRNLGAAGPAIYILFVTLEVVIAPLPGLMLYAPGGIIFGGFWGGFYSLIGNVLGASTAYLLMQSLFGSVISDSFERHALQKYETLIEERGIWIIALLRLNPLTSSDLVSYAAGLTDLPMWKLVLGTVLGMAPLCWLQSYLAEGLIERFPLLLYPLILLCVVYAIAVVMIIRKMGRRSGSGGSS